MRQWAVVVVVCMTGIGAGVGQLPLPVLNLPLPPVVGPGPLIVAGLWTLKVVAIAGYFILTRKIVPVFGGEPKKKYVPYIPPEYNEVYAPVHGYPAQEHHAPPPPPPEEHQAYPAQQHHVPPPPPPPKKHQAHPAQQHHVPPPPPPEEHHAKPAAHEGESSYSSIKKRSIEDVPEMGGLEEMLTTALHMDTSGCSLKVLCYIHDSYDGGSTKDETVLLQILQGATRGLLHCRQQFPNCPFSGEELRNLLQQI